VYKYSVIEAAITGVDVGVRYATLNEDASFQDWPPRSRLIHACTAESHDPPSPANLGRNNYLNPSLLASTSVWWNHPPSATMLRRQAQDIGITIITIIL
jgi:hypothetical protein